MAQFEKERTSLSSYDLWGAKTAKNITPHAGTNVTDKKKFKTSDHAKEMDGRKAAKRPTNMKYKPDHAKKVDSVVVAHGGASYNPDYDAHQVILVLKIKELFCHV